MNSINRQREVERGKKKGNMRTKEKGKKVHGEKMRKSDLSGPVEDGKPALFLFHSRALKTTSSLHHLSFVFDVNFCCSIRKH